LAWEVTALQNLLLTGILVLCARFLEDDDVPLVMSWPSWS
jgi:hypothetical protein